MDQHQVGRWAQDLASGSEQRQVSALRQISSRESVLGLAATVVALSGSENDEIRMWAAEAMETAIQPQKADMESLIEMMTASPDGEVCYWSATMIGRLGLLGAAAVPALEDCLLNSNYLAARERAVWALSQVGPNAVAALTTLQELADQPDQHVRLSRLAAEVVRRLTTGSASGVAA